MKKLRILWAICFTAVLALFCGWRIRERLTVDNSGPRFSCENTALTVSIQDGEAALLKGVTAVDAKDGDVTDSIIVEKLSNFYGDGKRTVTYVAVDSDHHIAKLERELTYSDYISPRFDLTGSLRFSTGEQVDLYSCIQATDCMDGDISNKIKVQLDSSINNRIPGTYSVEYSVTNSAGETIYLPVEVEIYQYELGMAKLGLSDYLLYYDGEEPDYKSLLVSLQIGNTMRYFAGTKELETSTELPAHQEYVTVQSMVNPDVPGVYPVYLHYNDNHYEGMEIVMVVVEE